MSGLDLEVNEDFGLSSFQAFRRRVAERAETGDLVSAVNRPISKF